MTRRALKEEDADAAPTMVIDTRAFYGKRASPGPNSSPRTVAVRGAPAAKPNVVQRSVAKQSSHALPPSPPRKRTRLLLSFAILTGLAVGVAMYTFVRPTGIAIASSPAAAASKPVLPIGQASVETTAAAVVAADEADLSQQPAGSLDVEHDHEASAPQSTVGEEPARSGASAKQVTPARAAAALAAGEYERALQLYRALASQESERPVYAVIVRFLEQTTERPQ